MGQKTSGKEKKVIVLESSFLGVSFSIHPYSHFRGFFLFLTHVDRTHPTMFEC